VTLLAPGALSRTECSRAARTLVGLRRVAYTCHALSYPLSDTEEEVVSEGLGPETRADRPEGRRRLPAKPPKRKVHWAVRLAGWLLALFFLGVIGLAVTFFIGYKLTDIPDPNKDFQTNTTYVFYSDGKNSLGQFAEQNRSSVDLKTIPKYVQDAHIAAEDRTYWTNPGIEPSAMIRAGWNIARGQDLQGGSTITQQYVKLMYLTQERTITRKFKELFIAIKLSRSDDKAQILEDYLNTIYYGRGAYGIRAAGIAFYGKNQPAQLTTGEAALLATILNNPTAFDPDEKANHDRILERYRYVLDGMQKMGTITAAQEAQLRKDYPKPIPPKNSNKYAGPKGFLLSMAKERLRSEAKLSDEEIAGGGLRVITTFDSGLQDKAVRAVQDEDAQPKSSKDPKQPLDVGLASVKPESGELVAMYGGADYLKSQLNWARLGGQAGSAFKPFAVAAGLKDGFTLRDRFQGTSPYVFDDGESVQNEFGQSYKGSVDLLRATEDSINTAFADLTMQMEDGPQKIAAAAEAAGIPKLPDDQVVRSISMGTSNVSPIQMAAGYATFANLGRRNDVFVIKEVRDSHGKVLYKHKDNPQRAFDEKVAVDTTYALQHVVEEGTGTRSQIDRPSAGKTGTAAGIASEHGKAFAQCLKKYGRDSKRCQKMSNDDTLTSWFAGYTPQLSTAVLYRAGKDGRGDLDPFSDRRAFEGGRYPARLWKSFMEAAHEGLPEEDFKEPSKENKEPTRTPRDDSTPSFTPSEEPTRTPTFTLPPRPTKTPHKPTKTPTFPTPTDTPSFPFPTRTPRR
jgi:membrane peptidoglycan carboxypeptidase